MPTRSLKNVEMTSFRQYVPKRIKHFLTKLEIFLFFLLVLAKEFTTWPLDATVETGDPARFACEIESVPEAEITWEKDGAPVASDQSTDRNDDEEVINGTENPMSLAPSLYRSR